MPRPHSSQSLHVRWFAGGWLAMLALLAQIVAAAILPCAEFRSADADWLIASAICHAGGATSGDSQTPSHHHAPTCLACPLCQAVAQGGLRLTPPAAGLAEPAAVALRLVMPPPARAPPARCRGAACPRAPPALV